MPTLYDVFARIVERAPAKPAELMFKTPIYTHLAALVQRGLIRKVDQTYVPTHSSGTKMLFEVIRTSLRLGLNYNVLLSPDFSSVLTELASSQPKLRGKGLQGNATVVKVTDYLVHHQFILLTKKRPLEGTVLGHTLLNTLLRYEGKPSASPAVFLSTATLMPLILKQKIQPLNIFDNDYFAQITGSAQLEGSTVTEGETVDIIMKDIYPDKPGKDVQMVKNLNEAMHYALTEVTELTLEHLQEINRRILFSLHRGAGEFKKVQNKIQGNPHFKTTPPALVHLELTRFCDAVNALQTKEQVLAHLGQLHNDLQRIHPFADGNSRTTRTIINWILAKHDLPPLIIKPGAFETYMNLTKLSTKRDDERLNVFLLHLLLHEQLV